VVVVFAVILCACVWRMSSKSVEINEKSLEIVKGWATEKKPFVLGIDIGATNTRIGVATRDQAAADYIILCTLVADDVSKLAEAIAVVGSKLPVPAAACGIDAAGPVSEDKNTVVITNWPESHDRTIDIRKLDERVCPRGATALLNDLEACCHGISALSAANQLGSFFELLDDPAKPVPTHLEQRKHLVMAMGTGLGVGVLLETKNATNDFTVLPMEIGHTIITHFGEKQKNHDSDEKFLSWLGKKVYDGVHSPEFEDICSGRGLAWAYEFLTNGTVAEPKDVAQGAMKGDKNAENAMLLHYRFLLRVAQNTCVGLQTKGVILCGDNQVHNHAFVRAHAAELMEEFMYHPKQNGPAGHRWLEGIPIFIQKVSVNANMIGCVCVADVVARA